MSNNKIQSWDWDVRVRNRNLSKGLFDQEQIEKHKSKLADVADQADAVALPQPALGGRED